MKFNCIFPLMLAAMVGISTLNGAEKPATTTTTTQKAKKKTKAPLTLKQEIALAKKSIRHKRHIQRLTDKKIYAEANKDKIKILMLGDSITHQWEYPAAAQAHEKYIAPYNVLNLGCGGDRTSSTIWIIEKSGILELINPKLVTIMIGTNNRFRPQATAEGIKYIVDSVRRRYPDAVILLYAIFPRGADKTDKFRIVNEQVNDEIVKICDGKKVIWMDIRKNFLDDQGNLSRSMMPDYLHPRKLKGYSVWGESLRPYFEKYGK